MSEEGAIEPPKSIAAGRFLLTKQLGSGCFGEVWLGDDQKRSETVAVKLEVKSEAKHLANEYEILSNLKSPSQQQGFTEVFHFGREGKHICLVMELLGKSLEDVHEACGGKFNVKTTALIAEQILHRLEYLHSKCVIHRDIKPENFMMGVRSKSHIVYLIDFGLSELYYDEGEHAFQMKDTLTGTARYASINAHDMAQSRRDDLEAVGHMLVFFLLGTLPWSGLKSNNGEKKKDGDEFAHIRAVKKATKVSELCKGLPPEFEEYLTYCRGMQYKQRPDYIRLRDMFRRVLDVLGNVKGHELQWLLEDKELKVGTLTPLRYPDQLEQPDDGQEPRFSICGCCKRREEPSRKEVARTENRPLAAARENDEEAESIGKSSKATE